MAEDINSFSTPIFQFTSPAPGSLATAHTAFDQRNPFENQNIELASAPTFVNYADAPFAPSTPVPVFTRSSDIFTLDTDPFGTRTQKWGEQIGSPVDSTHVAGLSVFGRAMSREQLEASEAGRRLLELEEKKRNGVKRDFWEAILDFQWSDVPFLSLFASVGKSVSDAVTVSDTFKKLQNGEAVSDEELIKTRLYMAEQEYNSNGTWGSTVGDIMRAAPGFMVEFLASGGLYAGARVAANKVLGRGIHLGMTRAAKVAARELMEAGARKKVGAEAVEQAVKDTVVTGVEEGVKKKTATEIAGRIASLADDTNASDELVDQVTRALLNKNNGLMRNNPLYKGMTDEALEKLARNRAQYEFNQLIARNSGGAVARMMNRSAQWAKNHISRGLMDFGTWGTDEATVAFTNHSKAGRALFDALGTFMVEAPIKGSLLTLPNAFIAKPIAGQLLGQDGRTVSASQLSLQQSAYMTGNKELMESAESIAMGVNLLEYVSENAGRGFSSLARAAGLGLKKLGVNGLVAPSARTLLDSGDLLPVDQSAVTIGGKIREYIQKALGTRQEFLQKVQGDEIKAVTRAFNLTDPAEKTAVANAITHRNFSTLSPALAQKLGVDPSAGAKSFDVFMKDLMSNAYDKSMTDMAYKSYARFAVANFMVKHHIGPESIMNLYQKMGYDGILGEMFEERYSDFAKGLMGLDDRKHHDFISNLKEAVKSLYPGFDQLTAEAVGFAMPLVTRGAIMRLQSSIGGGGKLREIRERLDALDDAFRLPLGERMTFGQYERSYHTTMVDLHTRILSMEDEKKRESDVGNQEAADSIQHEIDLLTTEQSRRMARHKEFSTDLDLPARLAAVEKELAVERERADTARSSGSVVAATQHTKIIEGLEKEAEEMRQTADRQNIDISNLATANVEAMIGVPVLTADQYRASEEVYNLYTLPTSEEANKAIDAQDAISNYAAELAPILWKATNPTGGKKWLRYAAGKISGLAGAIVTGDFSLAATNPEQWVARDMGMTKRMCDTLSQEFGKEWDKTRKTMLARNPETVTMDAVTEAATKSFAPRARALMRSQLMATHIRSFSNSDMLDQALMYTARLPEHDYQVDHENRRFVKFTNGAFDESSEISFDAFYEANKEVVNAVRDDIAVATFDILTRRFSTSADARQSLLNVVRLPADSEILAPAVYDLAMRMVEDITGGDIVRTQIIGDRPIEDDLENSGLGTVNEDLVEYVVRTLDEGRRPDDMAYAALAYSLRIPFNGTEESLAARNRKIDMLCRLNQFSHDPNRFYFSREVPIDATDVDKYQRCNKVRIEVIKRGGKYVTVKGFDEHGNRVTIEHDKLEDFSQDGFVRETPKTVFVQKQALESDDMYLMLRQLNLLGVYKQAMAGLSNENLHPKMRTYTEEEIDEFIKSHQDEFGGVNVDPDALHDAMAEYMLRKETGLAQYASGSADGKTVEVNDVPKGSTPADVEKAWNIQHNKKTGYIAIGEEILRKMANVETDGFFEQMSGYRTGEVVPRRKYKFVLANGGRRLVSARTFISVDVRNGDGYIASMINEILRTGYARNSKLISDLTRSDLARFMGEMDAAIQREINNPRTPKDLKSDLIKLQAMTLQTNRVVVGEDGTPKVLKGVGISPNSFVLFASSLAMFQDVRRGADGLASSGHGRALAHMAPYLRQLPSFPAFLNTVDLVIGGNGFLTEYLRDKKDTSPVQSNGLVKLASIIAEDTPDAYQKAMKQALPGGLTYDQLLERCLSAGSSLAKNPIPAIKPRELREKDKNELRNIAAMGLNSFTKYTLFFGKLAEAFELDGKQVTELISHVVAESTEASAKEAAQSKKLAYDIKRKEKKLVNASVKLVNITRELEALGVQIKELTRTILANKRRGQSSAKEQERVRALVNMKKKLTVDREQAEEEKKIASQNLTGTRIQQESPSPVDSNLSAEVNATDKAGETKENLDVPAPRQTPVIFDEGLDTEFEEPENYNDEDNDATSIQSLRTDYDQDLNEMFSQMVQDRLDAEDHVMTEDAARLGVNIVVRAVMAEYGKNAVSESTFLKMVDKLFNTIDKADRALMLTLYREAENFIFKHGGSWEQYGVNGSKWGFTEDDIEDDTPSEAAFNKSAVGEYNKEELSLLLDFAHLVSPETGRNLQAFFTGFRTFIRDGKELAASGVYSGKRKEAFEFLGRLIDPRADNRGKTYNERRALYDQFVTVELNDTDKVNEVISTLLETDGNNPVSRRGAFLLSYLASLEGPVRLRFLDLVSESTISDMVQARYNEAGQLQMEMMTKTDISISVDMLRNVGASFSGRSSKELLDIANKLREAVARIPRVDSVTANSKRRTRKDRKGTEDVLAVAKSSVTGGAALQDSYWVVVSNMKVLADVIGSVIGRENPLYSALISPSLNRYIATRYRASAKHLGETNKKNTADTFPQVLKYIADVMSPKEVKTEAGTTVTVDFIESLASVLDMAGSLHDSDGAVTLDEIEPFMISMFSTGDLHKGGVTLAPSTPMSTDAWNTFLGMYEDSQPVTVRRAVLDQYRDHGASSSVAIASPGVVPIISRFMDRRFKDFIEEALPNISNARNWDELTPEVIGQCRQDMTWPDPARTPIVAKNISKSYDAVEILNACAESAVRTGNPVWIPVYAGDKNSAVLIQVPYSLAASSLDSGNEEALKTHETYMAFARKMCDEIGLDLLGDDTKRVALSSMTAAGTSTIGVREPSPGENPTFGEHRVHIVYNYDLADKCKKNNESFFGNTIFAGYAAERQKERAKTEGTSTLKCHAVSTEGDSLAFIKALAISTSENRGRFLRSFRKTGEGDSSRPTMRVMEDYLIKELGNDGAHSTHTLTDKDSYKIGIAGSKTIRIAVSFDEEGNPTKTLSVMDFVFDMLKKLSDKGDIDLKKINMTTEDLDNLAGEVIVYNTLTKKSEQKTLSELLPSIRLKTVEGIQGATIDLSYVDNNISYFSVANVSHDANTKVNRTPRNHVIDAFTMAMVQKRTDEVLNKDSANKVLDLVSYWGLISNVLNSQESVINEIARTASGVEACRRYGESIEGQNALQEIAKNTWARLRKTSNIPLYSIDAPLVSAAAEIGKDGKVYYQTDSEMQKAMMVGSQVFTKTEAEFYQTNRRLALCNVNIRHGAFRYGWFLDREAFSSTYKVSAAESEENVLIKLEELFTSIRNETKAIRKLTGKEKTEKRKEVLEQRKALMNCFVDHHNRKVGERVLSNGKSYAETVSFEDLFTQGRNPGEPRRFDRSAVQIGADKVHNDDSGKSHIFLGGTTFGFPRTPSYNGSMWLQTVRAGLPVTEIEHLDEKTQEVISYEVGKDAMVSADPFTNKILGCDHDGDKTKLYMYFSRGGEVGFVDADHFAPFDNLNGDEFVSDANARNAYFQKCLGVRGSTGVPMFVKKRRDADGRIVDMKDSEPDNGDWWYELHDGFRYLYSNSFVQCLFDMSRDLECKPATDERQQFADGPMSRETKADPLDPDGKMLGQILKEAGAPAVVSADALLDDPSVAARVSKMAMDASDARAKVVSLASTLHIAWASGYFKDGLMKGMDNASSWIKFMYLVDGISNATFDDLKNQKCSRLGWTSDMMEVLITDILYNRNSGTPVTTKEEMYQVLLEYAKDVNKTKGARFWMKNTLDVTNVSFAGNIRALFGALGVGEKDKFNPRAYDPGVQESHLMSFFGVTRRTVTRKDGTEVSILERTAPVNSTKASVGQALAFAFEKAGANLELERNALSWLISGNTRDLHGKVRLGYLGWLVKDTAGNSVEIKGFNSLLSAIADRSATVDLTDSKTVDALVKKAEEFLRWVEKFSQLNEASEFAHSVNFLKADPGNDNATSTRDQLVKGYEIAEGHDDELTLHFHRMHTATRAAYNVGNTLYTAMARAMTSHNRLARDGGPIDALRSRTDIDQTLVEKFIEKGLNQLNIEGSRLLPVWDKLAHQSNQQQIPYILAVLQTRKTDAFKGALNAFDRCLKIADTVGEARRKVGAPEGANLEPELIGNAVFAKWGNGSTPVHTSKVLDFCYGVESAFDLMYRLAASSGESLLQNAFSYFRMAEDASYTSGRVNTGLSGKGLRRILLQFSGGSDAFVTRARRQIDEVIRGVAFTNRDPKMPRFLHGKLLANSFALSAETIDNMVQEASMTKKEGKSNPEFDKLVKLAEVVKAFVKAVGEPVTPQMMFSDILPIYTAVTERTLGTPDPRSNSLFTVLGGYEELSRQQVLNDKRCREVVDCMVPHNFGPVTTKPTHQKREEGDPIVFRRNNPEYRHRVDIFSPGFPFRTALQILGTPATASTNDDPGKVLGGMLAGDTPVRDPGAPEKRRIQVVERVANAMNNMLPWANAKYEGGNSFTIHGNLRGNRGTGKRMVIAVNVVADVNTEEDVTRYANSYAYAQSLTSSVDLGLTAREFLDTLPLDVRKALVRRYGIGGAADNRITWSCDGKTLAGAIMLRLPGGTEKVGTTMYHEYFHVMMRAFEELGMFSETDYKAFATAFGKAPKGSNQKFNEEKAAEAFRKWIIDKETKEAEDVRSVFRKMYDFVVELIQALVGGFNYGEERFATADTLFSLVISGVAQMSDDAVFEANTVTGDFRRKKTAAKGHATLDAMASVASTRLEQLSSSPVHVYLGPQTADEKLGRAFSEQEAQALANITNPNIDKGVLKTSLKMLSKAGKGILEANGESVPPEAPSETLSYSVIDTNVEPIGSEEASIQETQVAVKLATLPINSFNMFYKMGETIADAVREGLAAEHKTLQKMTKRFRDSERSIRGGLDAVDKQIVLNAIRQTLAVVNPEAMHTSKEIEESTVYQALLVAANTINRVYTKPDAFMPLAEKYLHGGETPAERETKSHASAFDIAGWVLASRAVSPHDLAESALSRLRELKSEASPNGKMVIYKCEAALESLLAETGDYTKLIDWVAYKGSATVNDLLPSIVAGLKKPEVDADGNLMDYETVDDPEESNNPYTKQNYVQYTKCLGDRQVQEALKLTVTTLLQGISMNKYYRDTGVLPGTYEDLEAHRTFTALNIPDHVSAAEWFSNQAIGNGTIIDDAGLIDYQNQSGFIGENVNNWLASHIRRSFGNTTTRDMMMAETHEYEWIKAAITRVENRHAMLLGDNADAGAELLAALDHESEFNMEYGEVKHVSPDDGRNDGFTYKFDNLHKKGCGVRLTVDELRTIDLFKKHLSAYANNQAVMLTGVNRITFEPGLPDAMLSPEWYAPENILARWNNAKPGDQFTRMEIACVRMLRQLHKEVLEDPSDEGNKKSLGLYNKFVNTACEAMARRNAAIEQAKDDLGGYTNRSQELAKNFNSRVLQDLEAAGILLAQRNDDGTLKQGTLVLNCDEVNDMFLNSSAYDKLTKQAGRDPKWISRETLTKELMQVYRKAADFAKTHAWITQGDAKYLNTFGTPIMHFSGSGIFMYDAVRVSRDNKKSRSTSIPRYVESYKNAMKSERAGELLSEKSVGVLEIVTDIFKTREEGIGLLEAIKSGAYRAGTDNAVKTGLEVEPDATNGDLAEIIYQKLLDLAWQEQVSDGKLNFNVRSIEDMIELYETERGTAQNFATGGLGINDVTMFKRYGILPANMQLGHKVHTAIDQITNSIMQRNTLVNMLFTPSADGAPVYMANPSEFAREQNGKSIPDAVWSELARWWSEYFGNQQPRLSDKLRYDESIDGIANARNIYSALSEIVKSNKGKLVSKLDGTGDHRYAFFPEGESDLVSIDGWLVMNDEDLGEESSLLNATVGGEAMGYLKQAIQAGRVLGLGGAGVRQHIQRALSWSKSLSVSFSMFFPLATKWESPIASVGAMATMASNRKLLARAARSMPGVFNTVQKMFGGSGWITKDFLGFADIVEMMDSNDPFLADLYAWAAALGVTVSDRLVNPMEPNKSRVVEDIKYMKRLVKEAFDTKTAAKFGNMMESMFLRSGEKAFTYALNATKLATVAQLAMKLRYEAAKRGKAFDPIRDLRKYSGYINAEVGGIDPAAYAWATPRFRSMMNSLLFSWEWTRGAWEAGGGHAIEDLLFGGHTITRQERQFMLGRWARMWGEVMIGVPMLAQVLCKAFGIALGHDDDEDEWFAWRNEGKVGASAFDLTPVLRGLEKVDDTHLGGLFKRIKQDGAPGAAFVGGLAGLVKGWMGGNALTGLVGTTLGAGAGSLVPSLLPMYTGGDPANQTTMNRRYYMHFGKQGWEFFRWFEAPGQQFMTKLSMPTQRLLEGFFGRNLSYLEKELPWSDQGPLERWLPVPDSAFLNYFKAFLPFSVNGINQFGDAGFLPIFGPVSMGASQTAIQDRLVKAVNAWANNDRSGYKFGIARKSKNSKYNVGMVIDILRDAERNGLDTKDMYDKALGQVMTRVYSRLFRALPTDPSRDFDAKEIERCARILNRLGAKKKSIMQSIKKRLERQGRDWDSVLTPEQRDMYKRIIGTAVKHPFDFGVAQFGIDY